MTPGRAKRLLRQRAFAESKAARGKRVLGRHGLSLPPGPTGSVAIRWSRVESV